MVQVGATAALPWGFTVGGSGSLRWTGYEGEWFPFTTVGTERRDLTRSLRVFAHNRALTLEGFSPQVSVVQEQRTSNAQLHDYERIFRRAPLRAAVLRGVLRYGPAGLLRMMEFK